MNKKWSNPMALSAAYTLVMTVPNLSPFFLVAIMGSLGIDEAEAGALLTLELAILALIPMLLASAAPRFDLRKTLITGSIIWLLANTTSIFLESVALLAIVRMCAGFGAGLLLLGVNRAISVVADPVKMYGIVNTLALVTAFVLFFFLPSLVDNLGLVGAYGLLTALVIIVLPLIIGISQIPRMTSKEAKLPPIDISPSKLAMLLTALFAIAATYMACYALAEPIGTSRGFTRGEMGILLAIVQIGAIAGTSAATWLGLRLGTFLPLFISLVGVAISAMLCTGIQSTVVFPVALFMMSFFFLFSLPYQLGIGAQIDHTGRLASAGNGIVYLGAAFAPFLGGYLITHYGQTSIGIINCAAVAIGLVFYWLVTRIMTISATGSRLTAVSRSFVDKNNGPKQLIQATTFAHKKVPKVSGKIYENHR